MFINGVQIYGEFPVPGSISDEYAALTMGRYYDASRRNLEAIRLSEALHRALVEKLISYWRKNGLIETEDVPEEDVGLVRRSMHGLPAVVQTISYCC